MTGRHVHRDGIVADKAAFEAKYEFVRAIGDGGQAGVYEFRRRDPPYDRVAVKEFGCLTSREWRILAAVRHPHICGLVDEARYENPRVHTTKIVVDCMDTSLQAFLHSRQKKAAVGKENKENKERRESLLNNSSTGAAASPPPGQEKKKSSLLLDTAMMQQQQREQRVLHKPKKGSMGGDEAGEGGAGGEEGAGSRRAALDLETVRGILYALTLALDYLHHKLIVHLDVK
jgi:serine/threonine protein kinase